MPVLGAVLAPAQGRLEASIGNAGLPEQLQTLKQQIVCSPLAQHLKHCSSRQRTWPVSPACPATVTAAVWHAKLVKKRSSASSPCSSSLSEDSSSRQHAAVGRPSPGISKRATQALSHTDRCSVCSSSSSTWSEDSNSDSESTGAGNGRTNDWGTLTPVHNRRLYTIRATDSAQYTSRLKRHKIDRSCSAVHPTSKSWRRVADRAGVLAQRVHNSYAQLCSRTGLHTHCILRRDKSGSTKRQQQQHQQHSQRSLCGTAADNQCSVSSQQTLALYDRALARTPMAWLQQQEAAWADSHDNMVVNVMVS